MPRWMIAVALGCALTASDRMARAQQPPRADLCTRLMAAGLPASTVQAYLDAMPIGSSDGSRPTQADAAMAQQATEVVRHLPVPAIVGVVPLIPLRYTPDAGLTVVDFTRQFAIGQEHAEVVVVSHVEERVRATNPTSDGRLFRSVTYGMTLGRGTHPPVHSWRRDGDRPRIKVSVDPQRYALVDYLRLVVAGTPRPPFTHQRLTEEVIFPRPRDVRLHYEKIAVIEPLCVSVMDARTGKDVAVIR